jgi:hypothetical protein
MILELAQVSSITVERRTDAIWMWVLSPSLSPSVSLDTAHD